MSMSYMAAWTLVSTSPVSCHCQLVPGGGTQIAPPLALLRTAALAGTLLELATGAGVTTGRTLALLAGIDGAGALPGVGVSGEMPLDTALPLTAAPAAFEAGALLPAGLARSSPGAPTSARGVVFTPPLVGVVGATLCVPARACGLPESPAAHPTAVRVAASRQATGNDRCDMVSSASDAGKTRVRHEHSNSPARDCG
jgi:hypothetical protein